MIKHRNETSLQILLGLTWIILSLSAKLAYADSQGEKAYTLAQNLRCVVCQNQSIAESDAAIAQDIRSYIASAYQEGKTDQVITQELIDLYGEYIDFSPKFGLHTAFLWLTPYSLAAVILYRIMSAVGSYQDTDLKGLK